MNLGSSKKIVHLSSVHHANDTRVFYKECTSLAEHGFSVMLIANADVDEVRNGVTIRALSSPGRLLRLTRTQWQLRRMALEEKADIYHLHDPELIPLGLLLKLRGKRVIYDVHEHVAKQIMYKGWIPSRLRSPIASIYRRFERFCGQVFDGIVVADPSQVPLFPKARLCVVENFPILKEYSLAEPLAFEERKTQVAYVGGLSEHRGVREMIAGTHLANEQKPVTLALAGKFFPPTLEGEVNKLDGWEHVQYRGFLDRSEVFEMLAESRVGIVVLHPIPNYVTSQPVKLLEYMLAGLPVVVCDFPYYRQYVESNHAGLMVDPLDTGAIAEAIVWLLQNPSEAESMGKNGRNAVITKYNWECEAEKLFGLYEDIWSQ